MSNKVLRYFALSSVLVAGVCTTIMNWRFAYQLTNNPFDAYVWAVFSVALDVCKWTMLACAALAWPTQKLRSIAATSIWLVATCYSFAAALGFAAITRDATIAERRSQSEIHDTLRTMRRSPRWHSSAACTDATAQASKDFCATYRAHEARLTAVPEGDDPQADLISRLAGVSQEHARLALAFSLAVACELVSALGLFAIVVISPGPHAHLAVTSHNSSDASDARLPPSAESSRADATIADLNPPRWRPRQK